MKQFIINFENKADFSRRLAEIKALCTPSKEMLFYIAWTENALSDLDIVTGLIEEHFPDANYYGNETSGNIASGVFTLGIYVTCCIFEDEDTKTELVWVEQGTPLSSLEDLWNYCRSKEGLRAVEMIPSMAYIETLKMDGNIPDVSEDILLFGGASVNYDNATYDADIIAKGHPRTQNGMAVMLYFGKNLFFTSDDILGWKGLGRLMEVTESTGKCIRQIDNSPAYSIYEKYLNLSVEDKDTLVFPLISEEDGKEFIRTPQTIMPDRSMQMFATVPNGTKVRIAYGDKNTILDDIYEKAKAIASFRPEAIKAYSCAARRLFWGDDEVSKETRIFEEIAPICGFYTGGEILRFDKKLRVLNQTLAIVAMREYDDASKTPQVTVKAKAPDKSLVSRLAYFTERVSEEQAKDFAKVKEEQRRIDLLHETIHSGKWSFLLNAKDEIIDARYSDDVKRVINNDLPDGLEDAWMKLLHPDDRDAAISAFQNAIADHSGRTPYDVIYRMADRNGTYNWFHSAGRIIRDEQGGGEFFGVHINITSTIEAERKQQQLLEEARIAAEQANMSKTNFLFNMSHDIRTPMNAIMGFTTMTKKHIDDKEKIADYLDKIETSGQQLLALINQVLEMARIESGKSELEEAPVNVCEEYNAAITVLSEQAKANGLTFNHSLKNLRHNHILADEAKMSSITLNIAGNAMKYTPEGGSVDYILEELPPRKTGYATFRFSVEDTGIGMSEDYLKMLFVPFTREKNSTVSKIQGTGLGMSIVKELVDLMGGNIEVHSQPGKGTRFDITTDFKIDCSVTNNAELKPNESTLSLKGKRVLLVEDNELNREIAVEILGEEGLDIDEAEDGSQAVEMVKKHAPDHYDFILMDVQMPVMNGYEATKAIRALPGGDKIPIIALSANAFAEDKQRSLEAGMNDHVAKPIKTQDLFEALAKFLTR